MYEHTIEFRNGAEIMPPSGPQPEPDSGSPAAAKKTEPARAAPARGWPKPPAPIAFHGLAGDFVRVIEPHSEADPVALLVQTLAFFGNVIGRGPYFPVEGDRHGLNLFVVLVGEPVRDEKAPPPAGCDPCSRNVIRPGQTQESCQVCQAVKASSGGSGTQSQSMRPFASEAP